jgi:hypothetical protein
MPIRPTMQYSRLVKSCVLSLLTCLGSHTTAQAGTPLTSKPFDLVLGVNATYNSTSDSFTAGVVSIPQGASSWTELRTQVISDANFRAINSAYDGVNPFIVRVGNFGVPLLYSSTVGSNVITLEIPALGISKVFNSQANRAMNADDMFGYLQSNASQLYEQLQQLLARESAHSPIAGNPGSLQSQMISDVYDLSFVQSASNIRSPSASKDSSAATIGAGVSYGEVKSGSISSKTTTLPLSYSFSLESDPRKKWTVYLPLTMTDTEGAKTYGGHLGASYRLPVTDSWAVTTGLGYGITGSKDLYLSAAMLAASVTSHYSIPCDGYGVELGNMIGAYQTTSGSSGDGSVNPGLTNTVLRNGAMVSVPTMTFGAKTSTEFSYVLTNYFGSKLYSNLYHEIGITLGTRKSGGGLDFFRVGLTYLAGENSVSATKLNFGYWF